MKIAVLSDIHSNLQALDAVVRDAREWKAQAYLVAGDIVGYGASPNQCIERLTALGAHAVAGNHDWGAARKTSIDYFNTAASEAIVWTDGQLSSLSREYLDCLPITLEIEGVSLAHANFISPDCWEYVLTLYEAGKQFEFYSGCIGVIGHSHVPFFVRKQEGKGGPEQIVAETMAIKPGERYLVNAGSVGQPRDGDSRAAYIRIDLESATIGLRRISYDVRTAQILIDKAGLPLSLAERLAEGR